MRFDAGADENLGATVNYDLTRKQIRVYWQRKDGTDIDQRLYPRTAKGLASAERTIQKRIDEGYLFPQESPRAKDIL